MFYVLALPVIAASKSTGILLGVFVFTILAVLYGLYQIGCKKGVSVKVWILGICMGVLIFGLFLWWIWPAADFDVKTVDYNMLTRIQEKIWKVAHGGLLGLFLDRGMEKLVLYPQYLLYGAGEGGFDRFTLASQVNEIHCCLFSVMFSRISSSVTPNSSLKYLSAKPSSFAWRRTSTGGTSPLYCIRLSSSSTSSFICWMK